MHTMYINRIILPFKMISIGSGSNNYSFPYIYSSNIIHAYWFLYLGISIIKIRFLILSLTSIILCSKNNKIK